MPFATFMAEVLYDRDAGYYQTTACRIGRHGDFTTAPEISPMLAWAMVAQWQILQPQLQDGMVVEVGPGTGQLAMQFLQRAHAQHCLPTQYVLVERNPHMQALQQTCLKKALPEDIYAMCRWQHTPPQTPWQGMMLANEILDAQPVHVFVQGEAGLMERCVGLDNNQNLCWIDERCAHQGLCDVVQALNLYDDVGYCSEVNLNVGPWLAEMGQGLQHGAIMLVDYGYTQREYYHWQRRQGTLMAYHQHQATTDILARPGLQDLTAHVDFSRVAHAAVQEGYAVAYYLTQAWFLMGSGVLDAMSAWSESERLKHGPALKQLMMPHGMGELFKVMCLTKGDINMGTMPQDAQTRLHWPVQSET